MNTRETKNVRKKAERVLKTLEAQAKKIADTQKIAKDFLKGFDEIVASTAKVKVAKPVKPAKVAKVKPAKPVKVAKAKAAKPVKAIKAKAAKSVKAVKAKAEKPVKAAKPAKPVKTRGDKPSLHEAIYKVMGNKTMNAEAVLAVLKEKGWAPNAQNQKGYVAYMLSSKKNLFARSQDKGRGFYKRIEKAAEAKPEAKPEAKAAAKPEAKPEAKPAKNNQKDEQILADLGVKTSAVAENPFRS